MSVLINKENSYEFAHLLLDIGEAFAYSGAEINRIEETFLKMGEAYGVKEINAFVIPAVITLTIKANDEFELTQTRRIRAKSMSTNLYRLEKLNNIVHKCKENPIDLDELRNMIISSNKPVAIFPFCLGSALAAGSFSIFFGGNVFDGLVASILALIICVFQRKISLFLSNRIILTFLCSFVVGLVGICVGQNISMFNIDKILIGNVMLLVPGVAVTVSVRDIILGDTISGSIRLVESLFLTGGLALGLWLSFGLIGG